MPKCTDLGQKRVRKVTSEERRQESVGAGRKGQGGGGARARQSSGRLAGGDIWLPPGAEVGSRSTSGSNGSSCSVGGKRAPGKRNHSQKLPLAGLPNARKWLNLQRPDNNRLCVIQMDTFAMQNQNSRAHQQHQHIEYNSSRQCTDTI